MYFSKGFRSLNDKNLGSEGKGLQSYQPSKFENDFTSVVLERGPIGLSVAGAGRQTFS